MRPLTSTWSRFEADLSCKPDHAYFGQKDIQQALLLRISKAQSQPRFIGDLTFDTVLTDLLFAHPVSENLHIIPTTRDPATQLALSSRNVYLSPSELAAAPVLHRALSAARETWQRGGTTGEAMIGAATQVVLEKQVELGKRKSDVKVRMDYFEVFDKASFEPIRGRVEEGREMVVAGALWVGKTRLLDNVLLGWDVD